MGWTVIAPVVINHRQMGNALSFPFFFSGTFPQLATVANGGYTTNANGFDIAFSIDPIGANRPPFQLIDFVATTGYEEMWVNVPGISSSFDVELFVITGNTTISVDQSSTATWDTGYKGVYHLVGSPLKVNDSTVNANNGTNNGATAGTGLFGLSGSGLFAGSGQDIDIGTPIDPSSGPFTIELWLVSTATPTNGIYRNLIGNSDSVGNGVYVRLNAHNVTSPDKLTVLWGTTVAGTITSALVPGTTYYLVFTYDGAGNAKLYLNGILQSSLSSLPSPTPSALHWKIGNIPGSYAGGDTWQGGIQEIRLSNVVRSQTYVTAVYNNIIVGGGGRWTSTGLTDDYVAPALPAPPPAPVPTVLNFITALAGKTGVVVGLDISADPSTIFPQTPFAMHIGSVHFSVTEVQRITAYAPNYDIANMIWIATVTSIPGPTVLNNGAKVVIP